MLKNKFNLQLFTKPVPGKKMVYLFRVLEDAATDDAMAMAFVTDNSNTASKDSDTTETKDGPVGTPGNFEREITATALLPDDDTLYEKLENAMYEGKIIEIWEVNLAKPAESPNKYKGTYYQGLMTEFGKTSNAEDHIECATTFKINGKGASGDVTVSDTQLEVANYVFRDTQKTGA